MSPSGSESEDQGVGPSLSDLLSNRTVSLETSTPVDAPGDAVPGENYPGNLTGDGLHQRDLADLTPSNYPHGVVDNLPIASIQPNEFQPRSSFDEESLASLTESVRALGVLQPILVRPRGDHGYELIAGERRWRAARRAGLETVPGIVRSIDDQRSLEEAIVENLHRADLNPIEEAAAYNQLVEDFALTQDEVARRVGKSRSAVANTMRLSQLSGAIQRLIVDGSLSAGHARALLSIDDRGRQRELALKVVEDGLSVREVEDLARSETQARRRPKSSAKTGANAAGAARKKSVAALEIERLLGDRFDTRVEVLENSGTGRIVINFADNDDLDRIFHLLNGLDS